MANQTWTPARIPDQSGRVAIVTGANSGIGFHTARVLAAKGAEVVLACRSREKGAAALVDLRAEVPAGRVELMELDLADLASVQTFSEALLDIHDGVDVLVNNAGIMRVPEGQTVDGFERQLGTNHLGHFALTGQLLPALLAAEGSRVVTVSSIAHRGGRLRLDDLMFADRPYDPGTAYAQSKLANLLFTFELQRRLEAAGASTISVAAHPGVSLTNLGNHLYRGWWSGPVRALASLALQSPARGALPTLRAALDPQVEGGEYYGPDGFGEVRGNPVRVHAEPQAHNEADARGLWQRSVALTGVGFEELTTAG